MKLSDIIVTDAIIPDLQSTSRDEVIEQLDVHNITSLFDLLCNLGIRFTRVKIT